MSPVLRAIGNAPAFKIPRVLRFILTERWGVKGMSGLSASPTY